MYSVIEIKEINRLMKDIEKLWDLILDCQGSSKIWKNTITKPTEILSKIKLLIKYFKNLDSILLNDSIYASIQKLTYILKSISKGISNSESFNLVKNSIIYDMWELYFVKRIQNHIKNIKNRD